MTDAVRLLPGSMSEVDALTCDDPIAALIARLSVTAVPAALADFINAEAQRPGADVNHILIGTAAFMVQMHSSCAAYMIDAQHVDVVLAQFQAVVDRTYRSHFVDSANEVSA
ncbi:hypothetical protein FHT86_002193 [Rhizobium sp. BK313]|uniref:hypothetical protein n=1 Tax=Rhizobium sp. BK313 TaxID=2587081 RepID=UPI00160E69F1|nr:hypothetical protein [Rhizobium sp. BK313]MBB3453937.1 hypothetical protein [Rhizobium sp. BK313]